MAARDAFRRALEDGDVRRLRRIWITQNPHLPEPTAREAEITMHIARTAAESVPFKKRAYSHSWLQERSYRSMLPDKLKPEAERIYPRVQEGVGISCSTSKEWLKSALIEVRDAMEAAVEDCFANGDKDPQLVKLRMQEARRNAMRQLFGGSR